MSNGNARKLAKAKEKLGALAQALKEVGRPENMKRYGNMSADMIRLRTRLGDGVKEHGGNREKLKPLAESTIEARKGNLMFRKSHNGKTLRMDASGGKKFDVKLHEHTRPSKSNLTHSGQLLDSVKVKEAKEKRVKIGPTGDRHAVHPGWQTKVKLTNEEVAKFVTEGGRPFNNLSRVEVKRVNDQVKRDLRAAIKRLLTKTK